MTVPTSAEKLLILQSLLRTCYLVCHRLSSVLSGTFRCLEIMSLVSAHGVALLPIWVLALVQRFVLSTPRDSWSNF